MARSVTSRRDRAVRAGSAGTGNAGGSSNPGTAGAGNTSPTGTAGTGAPSSSTLDLSGTPKYYRAIRLTNQQWAQAVQTVLNVPTGGLEAELSKRPPPV